MTRSTLPLPGIDPVDRGHVLYYDAAISMDMGLVDETRAALDEAEALFTHAGDAHGLSMVENLRCFHAAALGDYAEAHTAGERSCAYAREAGSKALEELAQEHLCFALLGLGADSEVRDEAALARCVELSRADVDRAEANANPYNLVLAHGNIANPLLELGELAQALAHLRRAVEVQQAHGFDLPYLVLGGADAASRLGRHETAVRLLRSGLDDLAGKGVALQTYMAHRAEAVRTEAQAALDHEAFRAAERDGKAMTIADALDLMLTLAPTPGAPVSAR